MRFLFDTDHLSILQRQTGDAYTNLSARIALYSLSDFVVSIVSFHEQSIGAHGYINGARKPDDVIKGYDRFEMILAHFKVLSVLPFDRSAAGAFERIMAQPVRGSTMDLRIASIALSQNLILLTRNTRDFAKVPELKFEDWTMAEGRSETIAL
jgi:tRNA(fMet)-specific endonuclease VapC